LHKCFLLLTHYVSIERMSNFLNLLKNVCVFYNDYNIGKFNALIWGALS
jgi:hypothetical protein